MEQRPPRPPAHVMSRIQSVGVVDGGANVTRVLVESPWVLRRRLLLLMMVVVVMVAGCGGHHGSQGSVGCVWGWRGVMGGGCGLCGGGEAQ